MTKQIIDFEQLIGATSLKNIPANWFYNNIADARNHGAQELGTAFVEYHKELLQQPELIGLLEHSASDANERALEIAREVTGKTRVLCSNLTHSSIEKAITKSRLQPVIVYANPNNKFQVSDEEIFKKISEHGKDIAIIVSTHGTTSLGNIETLATNEQVQELRKTGTLLHIDAAYGGLLSRYAELSNMPSADTITLDQYKFIGIPGTALLLAKKNLRTPSNVTYFDQSTLTMHTTFSAGPIAAWYATQEDLGEQGLKNIAMDCIHIAKNTAKELKNQGVKLILDPQLSTIPITTNSEEETIYIRDEMMKKGYQIGKIKLIGDTYRTHGVRISITPKVKPEYQSYHASKAVEHIAKLFKT
ncbi:MAG: aminotransferase class I/II-fold pyridoxal phosphate-dependent enzyme [Candidatus Woesearchaeota archaeon]